MFLSSVKSSKYSKKLLSKTAFSVCKLQKFQTRKQTPQHKQSIFLLIWKRLYAFFFRFWYLALHNAINYGSGSDSWHSSERKNKFSRLTSCAIFPTPYLKIFRCCETLFPLFSLCILGFLPFYVIPSSLI